jgi:hypothetical protein
MVADALQLSVWPPVFIAGAPRSGVGMLATLLGTPVEPESEFCAINETLLAHSGAAWDVPVVLAPGWELQPALLPTRMRASTHLQLRHGAGRGVMADIRLALTLPFWRRMIPSAMTLICVRSPLDVLRSIAARRTASPQLIWQLWASFYRSLLANTTPERRVITHYDTLFYCSHDELERVLHHVGIPPYPHVLAAVLAQLDMRRRQHWTTAAELYSAGVPASVLQLYAELCAEAGPFYQHALQRDLLADTSIPPVLGPTQRDHRAVALDVDDLIARLRAELEATP